MLKPGIILKKKLAKPVNSLGDDHHNIEPIPYPIIAPKIEPAEQIRAYLNDFDCEPKHNAISITSGGIGKNEASETAIKANATTPYFELDQFKTQL